MTILRVQAELPRDTNLPEDVIVNTWHFLTTASPPLLATKSAIATALQNFYQAIDGVVLGSMLSTPAKLKFYDLADAKPRVPVHDFEFALVPTSGGVPAEVAVCMSFQATKASGQNQARRRGRVFLGPVAAAIVSETAGRTAVTSTARAAIVSAGLALLTASNTAADWEWAVYSPTDNAAVAVNNGWVDDAFDTIRSRGERPTTRSVFITV